MNTPAADLSGIVNASGFMLQLAIEHLVRSTEGRHGFEIEASEHPWRRGDESGFIDLVLGRSTIRLVCECKRTRDGNWVFATKESAPPEKRARLLWTDTTSRGLLRGWFNFLLETSSSESAFCMIRGQGENDSPLLERLAGRLMTSVEALADEEQRLRTSGDARDSRRVYVPLVITSARLWICRYDPAKIDIASGRVDETRFEEVPTIRFKKALTTAAEPGIDDPQEMTFRRFRRLSREQERTVLVVNSAAFVPLLESWRDNVVSMDSGIPQPWTMDPRL